MVRERLERAGVRFDPTITLSGAATFLGIIVMIAGLAGTYYVLHYRVGMLEKTQERADKDHDAILQMQGDLKVIRAIVEKRSSVLFRPDPMRDLASHLPPAELPTLQ